MKKKIILIQPNYPTSPFPGPHLPVGLGYIAEQLIKADIRYEVVDMAIDDFNILESRVSYFAPDFIGISLMSSDIHYNYGLMSNIKNRFPSIKMIAGGPHISFIKEEALLDCPSIDYGIVHEGEDSLIELIQADSPEGIKGVIYRHENKVIYNGDRPYIQDLDKYLFPTYKFFDLSKYPKKIDIISSRGCPFGCIFCGAHFSMGKKWRGRSVDSIIAEIEFWYKQGYFDFDFVDSNFFFDKQRVISLCDALKDNNMTITMSSDGMRADDADSKVLQKMKEFGLRSVAIGVESANEEILTRIKKGETLSQIETAIKNCIDLDINVSLFFILGLPGETKKHIYNSFKFAFKYPIENVHFFNVNPLPKTELYEWAGRNNYLLASREDIFRNIGGMSKEPSIATPELSYDERKKLYEKGLLISKKVQKKTNKRKMRRKLNILVSKVKNQFKLALSILTSEVYSKLLLARFRFCFRDHADAFNILTHMNKNELLFLYHLGLQQHRGAVFVEIGSYLGASSCFLAAAAQDLGKGTTLHCVDTWKNEGMSEGPKDTWETFLSNTMRYQDIIIPHRGLSIDIARSFQDQIDLLFIDGDHSYQSCASDVEVWLPHLKHGGLIIMHDIEWAEGVNRVVQEKIAPLALKSGRLPNLYWAWLKK